MTLDLFLDAAAFPHILKMITTLLIPKSFNQNRLIGISANRKSVSCLLNLGYRNLHNGKKCLLRKPTEQPFTLFGEWGKTLYSCHSCTSIMALHQL